MLITKSYNNNIKTDDDVYASIICDDTMTFDAMNQCDVNDIVTMYLTTMYLNCRPQHDGTFGVFKHCTLLLNYYTCTN